MRVLLVEDHPTMRGLISDHLRKRGFAVDMAPSGDEALAAVRVAVYDAVILDLGLPDMDGMDVLRRLRTERQPHVPALILTARDSIEARVGGLDAGADDYILKPFDLAELEARLRAVLRRPGPRSAALFRFGDLTFDPGARSAAVAERSLELARREACLLEELLLAEGRVVVRDVLEERLYGFDDEVSANALEASVSRLRRKLVAAGSLVGVEVARGIGYRLKLGVAT